MSIKIIDKGATDTQEFTLPNSLELGTIDTIYIYYVQNQSVVVVKKIPHDKITRNISVTLSARETMRFMDKSKVRIQMKAVKTDGTTIKSDIMTRMVDEYIGR